MKLAIYADSCWTGDEKRIPIRIKSGGTKAVDVPFGQLRLEVSYFFGAEAWLKGIVDGHGRNTFALFHKIMEGKHTVWMILKLKVLSIAKWSIVLDPLKQGDFLLHQSICFSTQGCWKWLMLQTRLAFCATVSTARTSPKEAKTARTSWSKRGPWTPHWKASYLSNRVER